MRTRLILCLCAAAVACAAVACGKKGPPLTPFPNVPMAPTEVSARRSGDRVVVRFTIPRANQGGRQPANIERVDVYAWTPPVPPSGQATRVAGGPPPVPGVLQPNEVFKYAKLVGSVPVRRPPPPPPERKEGEPPPPPPPPPTGPGLDQGAAAQIEETLTPEEFRPVVLPQKNRKERPADVDESALTPPDVGPPLPPPPLRYYVVVGVNRHGTRGLPSPRQAVPLWTPPPPPGDVTVTIREAGIDVAWTSPAGLRHPLVTNLAPAPAVTARPGPAATSPPGGPGTPAAAPPAVPAEGPVGAPPPGDDEDEDDVSAEARSRREAAMQQAEDARAAAALASAQAAALEPAAPQAPLPSTTAAPGAAGNPPAAGAPAPQAVGAAVTPATPGIPGAAPTTIPSRVPFPWPASGSGFMVYEVPPPGAAPQAVAPLPAVQPFPKPLTTTPLKTTTFSDPRIEYGTARCYAVRTMELVGTMIVESPSSPPACVTPRDVFPPAAPRSLGAVASEGVISLIWEANTESDVAGYLVLRGVAGGPLAAITPSPIRETTYRDTRVRRGTRYAYAVVAVDTATPPNRSPESNHVEETAR